MASATHRTAANRSWTFARREERGDGVYFEPSCLVFAVLPWGSFLGCPHVPERGQPCVTFT